MRYELADDAAKQPRDVPRVNDRRVLNGIFWVLRSGAPWRDLPGSFGPRPRRLLGGQLDGVIASATGRSVITIVIGPPPPGEGRNNARAGHGGPPTRGLDCLRTSVTKEGVF